MEKKTNHSLQTVAGKAEAQLGPDERNIQPDQARSFAPPPLEAKATRNRFAM